MGSELPDNVNLPPFIWQKKNSSARHRGPGSGKATGKTGALAIGITAASVAFVVSPFVYILAQHIQN